MMVLVLVQLALYAFLRDIKLLNQLIDNINEGFPEK